MKLNHTLAVIAFLALLGCNPPLVHPDSTTEFTCTAVSNYDKVTNTTLIQPDRKLFIPAFGGWILPSATISQNHRLGFWISYRFHGHINLEIKPSVQIYTVTNGQEFRYTSEHIFDLQIFYNEEAQLNEGKLANNIANTFRAIATPNAPRPADSETVYDKKNYTYFKMFVSTPLETFNNISNSTETIIRINTSTGSNDITIKPPYNNVFNSVNLMLPKPLTTDIASTPPPNQHL